MIAYKGFLSARADELNEKVSGYKKRVNKTRGYVDGIFSRRRYKVCILRNLRKFFRVKVMTGRIKFNMRV